MRNTRVVNAVTEILQQDPSPISLRELHERVIDDLPATAYSTVYRLLGRLEREGKVVRVDWRERGSRFEWAERPHHHHIVCSDCGHAVDVDDADVGFSERQIESRTGFRVKHHSIELEGTCAGCQADERVVEPSPRSSPVPETRRD
jgi:Fur family ferric uptake transcriptional regulator